MTDKINTELIAELVDAGNAARLEELARGDKALAGTVRRHIELRSGLAALPVEDCGARLDELVRERLSAGRRGRLHAGRLYRFAAGLMLVVCLGAVVSRVYLGGENEIQAPEASMLAAAPNVQYDTYKAGAAPVRAAVMMFTKPANEVAMRSVAISVKVEDKAAAEKLLTQALYNHSLLGSLSLTRDEKSSSYHFSVSGRQLASLAADIAPIVGGNENSLTITDYSNAEDCEFENIKGSQLASAFSNGSDYRQAIALADVENRLVSGFTPDVPCMAQPALAATPAPAEGSDAQPVSMLIEIHSR